MREMVHEYRDRSIQVYFVKLHHTLKQEFILADIIDPLGGSTIFSSIVRTLLSSWKVCVLTLLLFSSLLVHGCCRCHSTAWKLLFL